MCYVGAGMIESDGFNSPPPWGTLEAFCRRYKDGGGGNAGALEEQRKAREQSASQFAQSLAFQKQQYKDAQKIKAPEYFPPSAGATNSSDVYTQGIEARKRAQRRFGSDKTALNYPVLGGATPVAA